MKNKYGVLTKSNNAIKAEEMGLLTFSKLNAWQKRAVLAGVVQPREWHHTGAAANKTNYYSLEDFKALNKNNFKPEKAQKKQQPDFNRLKIQICFDKLVSGFTSRRKNFETVTVEGLDVRKKDNVIIGACGRRLSSNNTSVKFFYRGFKKKNFTEISKEEAIGLGYIF